MATSEGTGAEGDVGSTVDEILNRIQRVTRSWWTGDFFIMPYDALGDKHSGVPAVVFYGEKETEELYDAIYNLIEDWTPYDEPEQGSVVYVRYPPPDA